MTTGFLLLALHLICCILVYIGIRSHLLKIKVHMMPFVIFVPVSGVLCCLFLHFQLFTRQSGKRMSGIEKMKLQEEIYQGIFAESGQSDRGVVSMEEALLINDAGTRRNLMMDVLYDHPEEYVDVLLLARMNEDVEVVHYATTALAELSKRYDAQLLRLDSEWRKYPDDRRLLCEYCDVLQRYLKQGIAEGQHEIDQRKKYSELLKQRLETEQTPQLFCELITNEMELGHYAAAKHAISEMERRWPQLSKCGMLKIGLYARSGQGDALQREIRTMKSQDIYISHEDRKRLEFWELKKEEE